MSKLSRLQVLMGFIIIFNSIKSNALCYSKYHIIYGGNNKIYHVQCLGLGLQDSYLTELQSGALQNAEILAIPKHL